MCVLRVKCVYCGMIIDCERSNMSKLLQHLHDFHPSIGNVFRCEAKSKNTPSEDTAAAFQPTDSDDESFTSTELEYDETTEPEEEMLLHHVSPDVSGAENSNDHALKKHTASATANVNTNCRSQSSIELKRSVLYQTSLRRWLPGGQPIRCPDCGAQSVPIIRAQANGVTFSSAVECLHCSRCNHLLGEQENRPTRIESNYELSEVMETEL
ncbi:uncharacterized protein LOC128270513 [Anopheles cruzii]|uniref:uncharacterized protein LOC128270513 n=1 Tax=Anopheles cruzii TaxID=68878 RepID=UPI0022EC8831|nr:uncharacterized protein LOC128270513 [Anopheles cruzii]